MNSTSEVCIELSAYPKILYTRDMRRGTPSALAGWGGFETRCVQTQPASTVDSVLRLITVQNLLCWLACFVHNGPSSPKFQYPCRVSTLCLTSLRAYPNPPPTPPPWSTVHMYSFSIYSNPPTLHPTSTTSTIRSS